MEIKFGKFQGRTFGDVKAPQLEKYIKSFEKPGALFTPNFQKFVDEAKMYIAAVKAESQTPPE